MENFVQIARGMLMVFRLTTGPGSGGVANTDWFATDTEVAPQSNNPNGTNVLRFPATVFDVLNGTSWFVTAAMHRSATDTAKPLVARTILDSRPDWGHWSSEGGVTTQFPAESYGVNAVGYWMTTQTEMKNIAYKVANLTVIGDPANNYSVSFEWPSGTQVGDYAVMLGFAYGGSVPIPTSPGWGSAGSGSTNFMGWCPWWKIVPAGAILPRVMISDVMP